MSATMLAWQRLAGGGPLAPVVITSRALATVRPTPPSPAARTGTTTGAHFAFGAGAGALYARLTAAVLRLPAARRVPGPARGALFGFAVWAVSYGAVMPRLGLFPLPAQDRDGRQPRLIAAHLVFGGTLGALLPEA
jgi:hypothetical protein